MISSQRLGERLAFARKRAKKTQADVAKQLLVARTTVVAIEKGERRPSNAELVKFAKIVGASLNDLMRENSTASDVSPRFRGEVSSRPRGADSGNGVVADAVDRLRKLGGHYVELERLHGLRRTKAPLETLQTYQQFENDPSSNQEVEGEDAARTVRGILGLGDEPVLNIDERLEAEAGLRIFYLDHLPSVLSAFLIWSDDIGGCIAINSAHPRERQRWSLLHEFGHFLRDREAGDVLEDSTRLSHVVEVFPEAFAKEFLLPAAGVQKRFAERCRVGKFTPVDIHAMARAFCVSFQAMALRLEDLRLLPKGTYDKIRRSGLKLHELAHSHEFDGQGVVEHRPKVPDRYLALAISAYDQGFLSEREFADYLEVEVVVARSMYERGHTIVLGDSVEIAVDFTVADLRSA